MARKSKAAMQEEANAASLQEARSELERAYRLSKDKRVNVVLEKVRELLASIS